MTLKAHIRFVSKVVYFISTVRCKSRQLPNLTIYRLCAIQDLVHLSCFPLFEYDALLARIFLYLIPPPAVRLVDVPKHYAFWMDVLQHAVHCDKLNEAKRLSAKVLLHPKDVVNDRRNLAVLRRAKVRVCCFR